MVSPSTPAQRPRDVSQMRAALARLHSDASRAAALAFEPRPSDVFVTTYPKSGTTWMQQIVHGLRTRGDMDFEEIGAVVPHLEAAHDLGVDLDQPDFFPRAYKTHFMAHEAPRGGRTIALLRDPSDVVVSFYRFFEGWMFEAGAIDLDRFALEFFCHGSGSGLYWAHLASWLRRRDDPQVLLSSFEAMKRDLSAVVERVAAFIGAPPNAVEIATRQARLEFMRAHERQFDDHLLREARDPVCGLPPGQTSKLRAGRIGDGAGALGEPVRDRLRELWREHIEGAFGFASYADLEGSL